MYSAKHKIIINKKTKWSYKLFFEFILIEDDTNTRYIEVFNYEDKEGLHFSNIGLLKLYLDKKLKQEGENFELNSIYKQWNREEYHDVFINDYSPSIGCLSIFKEEVVEWITQVFKEKYISL